MAAKKLTLAVTLNVELIEGGIQGNLVLLVRKPVDWSSLNVALSVSRKFALPGIQVAIHPEAAAKVIHVAVVQRHRLVAEIHRKIVLLQRLVSEQLAEESYNMD